MNGPLSCSPILQTFHFHPSSKQPIPNLSPISQAHTVHRASSPDVSLQSGDSGKPHFSQSPSTTLPTQTPEFEHPSPAFTDRALRQRFRAINRLSRPPSTNSTPNPPKSHVSFCWLRHSFSTSACLLRAQKLATALHRDVVSTFETISSALLTSVFTLHSPQPPGLYTNAHRHDCCARLTNCILLWRSSARLTKRPSRKCRPAKIFQSNPWDGYPQGVTILTVEGNGVPSEIAARKTEATRSTVATSRCFFCRPYTLPQATECPACCAEKCVPIPEAHVLRGNPNIMKPFLETLKKQAGYPPSWMLASSAPLLHSMMNSGVPNGVVPHDPGRGSLKLRHTLDDTTGSVVTTEFKTEFGEMRDGVNATSHQAEDLTASMSAFTI